MSGFQFKQFYVSHAHCAMKVNTDGILLGSWVKPPQFNPLQNVLDIGTGSGLIALMMAQRFEAIHIDAIDIDDDAVKEATRNVQESPWGGRIAVHHSSLQNFYGQNQYELIVSNPPYFTGSLHSPCAKRTQARHTEKLSFSTLMQQSSLLLKDEGMMCLVVPIEAEKTLKDVGRLNDLQLHSRCIVFTRAGQQPKRVLLAFQKVISRKTPSDIVINEEALTIRDAENAYTSEFRALAKDFYLKF
ncbi:tRNA1(Val) (adenine(37)-N6)-methyltransferase [Algicola sagamiensis]|uniref:tRNA1(Val) (adenine(37)-N6)-methyltransferase n=1 Tax=Algicola sagamiensis TaxID=163869 RepID=UPI00039F84A1|nr:methyltransferase [Algicola sagamiensis]